MSTIRSLYRRKRVSKSLNSRIFYAVLESDRKLPILLEMQTLNCLSKNQPYTKLIISHENKNGHLGTEHVIARPLGSLRQSDVKKVSRMYLHCKRMNVKNT